ncbi:hypothetical protein A2U01_0072094, partial [Trifolium medium]|nr:hypothetical protein [Trifolium medium]
MPPLPAPTPSFEIGENPNPKPNPVNSGFPAGMSFIAMPSIPALGPYSTWQQQQYSAWQPWDWIPPPWVMPLCLYPTSQWTRPTGPPKQPGVIRQHP